MTNVQKTASAISAVMLAMAAGAVLTPATSYADPPGHQVTYTVTSPNNLTATVNYVNSDPPSQAAYNADPSKFTTSVQAPLSAGTPVTYTATLANPSQTARISASGMLHWPDSGNGPASFHCEIAVDGQVIAQQDATTTVTCAA
ncbi:hypothetical protein A5753_19005 [Mycobacterium sp. 852002-51971_SCH5477799-a]|uniref:hypothetical protein n=1 Tax=Mycobacterium sp. 852002-51971_SCH5477799-a TaxID=1834106 RepID=UPI0007FECF2E|nr:hypothetical protein [Mycobacterium sp. 852002-51971_SCH5477799-a]OBF61320.1 hypothetical protein A5753_19005 [Mycobacterium sp. 852002-51971_SCH5477799-a]